MKLTKALISCALALSPLISQALTITNQTDKNLRCELLITTGTWGLHKFTVAPGESYNAMITNVENVFATYHFKVYRGSSSAVMDGDDLTPYSTVVVSYNTNENQFSFTIDGFTF